MASRSHSRRGARHLHQTLLGTANRGTRSAGRSRTDQPPPQSSRLRSSARGGRNRSTVEVAGGQRHGAAHESTAVEQPVAILPARAPYVGPVRVPVPRCSRPSIEARPSRMQLSLESNNAHRTRPGALLTAKCGAPMTEPPGSSWPGPAGLRICSRRELSRCGTDCIPVRASLWRSRGARGS